MDNHLVSRGEGLAAKFATVWPCVRMDALVFSQQIPALKVLGTVGALEGALARVNAADVEKKLA